MSEPTKDVEIPMSSKDHSGEIEKFTIQTGGRVKIPDEWLDYLDLNEGDDVIVACGDDSVTIIEWTKENLKEV